MQIKKLKIQNFKKFSEEITLEFNDDINIIVGDNESGKSSLLEAIEMCLSLKYRGKPLKAELTTDLFNKECVNKYIEGDRSQRTLPEILIELYVDGVPGFKGRNNSENIDTEGVFVRIYFDPELSESYAAYIENKNKISLLPVEFYKIDWQGFSGEPRGGRENLGCLFVDPARLHNTFGQSKYINAIINSALEKNARTTLNLNYRQLQSTFDHEEDVIEINNALDAEHDITNKSLNITADIASLTSWENNLQLTVDTVSFNQIGSGEQNQIQIKLALQNKAKDVDIIMIEEPENHLSHINLVRLISYIEKKNSAKQIFITTHSSYVLNKLSIHKLCLLSKGYTRFTDIDQNTVKTLNRLPGYDTLRVVLAQKIILVEGPSDELLLKKIYFNEHQCLPEENGIDIIVIRGIGFKNYLNIAIHLEHTVHIVKDNDGDYQKNIVNCFKDYDQYTFINHFSPEDNMQYSLEPSLIETNGDSEDSLNELAKIMLTERTFKRYIENGSLYDKKKFLIEWFSGENTGSKKVDSAIRIFDSEKKIKYPDYLKEALKFDA